MSGGLWANPVIKFRSIWVLASVVLGRWGARLRSRRDPVVEDNAVDLGLLTNLRQSALYPKHVGLLFATSQLGNYILIELLNDGRQQIIFVFLVHVECRPPTICLLGSVANIFYLPT